MTRCPESLRRLPRSSSRPRNAAEMYVIDKLQRELLTFKSAAAFNDSLTWQHDR